MSMRPSGCSQLSGPRPPGLSVHTLVHIGLQRPPGAWSHPDRRVLHLPSPCSLQRQGQRREQGEGEVEYAAVRVAPGPRRTLETNVDECV